ncbi:MAG: hypothetical protein ACI7YS_07985 [Flavobacterium sp.]
MEYIEGLGWQEQNFIEIFRAFNFLFNEGYQTDKLFYAGRGYPSLSYYNSVKKITVKVLGTENASWVVVIHRKKLFACKKNEVGFDISDYYQFFNSGMIKNENYSLISQADFIQTYLMPVIRGEKWIDKIVKR